MYRGNPDGIPYRVQKILEDAAFSTPTRLANRAIGVSVRPGEGLFVGTVHSFRLKHIVMPFGAKSDFAVPSNIGVASMKEQDNNFQTALGKAVGADVRASDWRIRMDKYRRCVPDQDSKGFAETDPERFASFRKMKDGWLR
jgi:hypothetical protein